MFAEHYECFWDQAFENEDPHLYFAIHKLETCKTFYKEPLPKELKTPPVSPLEFFLFCCDTELKVRKFCLNTWKYHASCYTPGPKITKKEKKKIEKVMVPVPKKEEGGTRSIIRH